VKIGFYTSVYGDQPIEWVADWAAGAGFDALEVDVSRHIGDPARAGEVIEMIRARGLEVCTLTYFGNLVDSNREARARHQATVTATVDAARENGVPIVCTFPGRDDQASEDDNYRQLAVFYGPLTARGASGNVKVILENWPGPNKNYLATTPAGWNRLFTLVPAENFGLNFDPSHLIWQGIDVEQALPAVADRVYLAHAKDTEIFADRQQQVGYFGSGWWTYRLPGHGRLDWKRWLKLLHDSGFDGVVSIEHEDVAWGWPGGTVERRKEGLIEARRVLISAMPT
jgi:sugar phosphate isomerase/epimerase